MQVGYLDEVVPAAELGEAAWREAERLAGLNRGIGGSQVRCDRLRDRVFGESLGRVGARGSGNCHSAGIYATVAICP